MKGFLIILLFFSLSARAELTPCEGDMSSLSGVGSVGLKEKGSYSKVETDAVLDLYLARAGQLVGNQIVTTRKKYFEELAREALPHRLPGEITTHKLVYGVHKFYGRWKAADLARQKELAGIVEEPVKLTRQQELQQYWTRSRLSRILRKVAKQEIFGDVEALSKSRKLGRILAEQNTDPDFAVNPRKLMELVVKEFSKDLPEESTKDDALVRGVDLSKSDWRDFFPNREPTDTEIFLAIRHLVYHYPQTPITESSLRDNHSHKGKKAVYEGIKINLSLDELLTKIEERFGSLEIGKFRAGFDTETYPSEGPFAKREADLVIDYLLETEGEVIGSQILKVQKAHYEDLMRLLLPNRRPEEVTSHRFLFAMEQFYGKASFTVGVAAREEAKKNNLIGDTMSFTDRMTIGEMSEIFDFYTTHAAKNPPHLTLVARELRNTLIRRALDPNELSQDLESIERVRKQIAAKLGTEVEQHEIRSLLTEFTHRIRARRHRGPRKAKQP